MKKKSTRGNDMPFLNINSFRKMKLILFLVSVTFLQLSAVNGYAQKASIDLHLSNVSLKEAIQAIEKQTEFVFFYSTEEVDLTKKVDVNIRKGNIEGILSDVFRDYSYRIENRKILLTPKPTQKSHKITGTVKDHTGESIIGANISVKGTTNGTITDIDGGFTLEVPSDNAEIIISYIGYKPQEIALKGKTTLNVVLAEDTQSLNEVVVVGYGTQKKANLTGAVSVANMDNVVGSRPVTSMSKALEGAVPGLQIKTENAAPGASSKINIRGTTNITGAEPLILMDNVPVDINTINPNDIESITVLKDASSAAIYGARAAYGVILLTAKKGSKDEIPRFNYSTNLTVSKPYELIEKAGVYETVKAFKDFGYSTYWSGQDVDKWLSYLDEYQQNPSKYPDGYTMEGSTPYQLRLNDIAKDMTQKGGGFEQMHNLSVNGGTARTAYRFSFGYTDQNGVLVSDKDRYTRMNISSYLSSDVTKWLTAQLTINYAKGKTSAPNTNGGGDPWNIMTQLPGYSPLGYYNNGDEELPFRTPRNLINLLEPIETNDEVFRALGKIIVSPLKDLKIIGEFTYDKKNTRKDRYDKKVDFVQGTNFLVESTKTNSFYRKDMSNTQYMAANIYASYEKEFGGHNFALTGGFNSENNRYELLWESKTDMINPDLPSISSATGTLDGKDSYSEYAILGAFYRLTYDYNGKYLFETNGRYDGSSKFPSGHRFGFFPSFSLAWRLSEENFMKNIDFLSNLKLRGTYGNIGNQVIPAYQFLSVMSPAKSIWLGSGETQFWTLNTPGLVSQNFSWEKVQTVNGGIDLGLFKNRFTASFDYYVRRTKDMFGPSADLPDVLGTTAPFMNSADLKTKGWELQLDWRDKIGSVNYSIGFNLFDSQATITRFENATGNLANNWDTNADGEKDANFYTGKKMGEIWGYVTDRYYTVDDFVEGSLDANLKNGKLKDGIPYIKGTATPNPGDILYKDLNGSGDISQEENTVHNPGDRKIIGNNTPRYHFGITGGAAWKGFDFSFFIQGIGKRDVWAVSQLSWPLCGEFSALHANTLDYWMPDKTDSYYPRIYQRDGENSARNRYTQTKYLSNGAYWRIKNITLGYTFPQEWLTRIKINQVRVFVSGEDLFTKHHLAKGQDPELTTSGAVYPLMTKYSFGLNVSF